MVMRSKRLEYVLAAGDELAAALGELTKTYPVRTAPETVAKGTDRATYRMWLAWAAIENASHLFGDTKARAAEAARWAPCPGCQGKGKTLAATVDRREIVCAVCKGRGKVAADA